MVYSASQAFPLPSAESLQRLHVYDGLMMNARRWGMVEDYNRQRQNVQYQALHQPGIVSGLGVRLIEPPESVAGADKYPWIAIQPGVAIDLEGNLIVVPASAAQQNGAENLTLKYPIRRKPPADRSITIYITLSYEPQAAIPQPSTERICEWFRIDEITHPPNGRQVELCRINLQYPLQLSEPADVLSPGVNQLDFRYRWQAKVRPQTVIRAAQIKPSQDFDQSSDRASYLLFRDSRENLSGLMDAVFSLYPTLEADPEIRQVLLTEPLAGYDVLHLPDGHFLHQIPPEGLNALRQFLQAGGGLLIETPEVTEEEFGPIQQQVEALLPNSVPLYAWEALPREVDPPRGHLLQRSPFLFGALPKICEKPIQIYSSSGLVLIKGQLSCAWGLANQPPLPRTEIRTAHELGINLLSFLWQRRHLTRLLKW